MSAADALTLLQTWRDAGWMRALDLAFARLLLQLDPRVPGSLLLAAGWLAQLEGRGHSCLPLAALAADPVGLLGWPAEAAPTLDAALADLPMDADTARVAWAGFDVLQIDPVDQTGASPLVLGGGRLWLRRYWRHEARVAAHVHARTVAIDALWVADAADLFQAADAVTTADAAAAPIDRVAARRWISRLFAPVTAPVNASVDAPATAPTTASLTVSVTAPVSAPVTVPTTAVDAPFTDPDVPTPEPDVSTPDADVDVDVDAEPEPEPEPDWQQVACALALRARLTLITGGPGTGKTWTAARLLVLLQVLSTDPAPLRVALAAPTGKAAARLRQSIDTALHELQTRAVDPLPLQDLANRLAPACTLHALLGVRPGSRRFVHDAANPLDVDLLVVDEASMIHLEMMAALLDALPPKARVVLLGDQDQLASVEAGAVLADLCQPVGGNDDDGDVIRSAGGHGYAADTVQWIADLTGQKLPASPLVAASGLGQQTVVLRRSRRFSGPIGRLAAAINRGDGAAALALLRSPTAGVLQGIEARDPSPVMTLAVDGRQGAPGGFRTYLSLIQARPDDAAHFDTWVADVLRAFDRFRVLCAVREGSWGVAGLNAAIEHALADAGLLQRDGEWYEGRPVMVTRNDRSLGVFNGDIGVVLRGPGEADRRRAWFGDATGLRAVAVGRLADVETAFAMTVHKSQGSEFEHVVLVLPKGDAAVLTRELVYTGITRAREALTVVGSDLGRLSAASGRRTRRLSGLRTLIEQQAP